MTKLPPGRAATTPRLSAGTPGRLPAAPIG
jgi:hypothetical protein